MLKTSESTKSTTRSGKGGIGVGDDRGGDGSDDSSHNDEHSPQYSGRAHQRTHQLVWPRLWLSIMGLMMVVVVTSWSKSRQKVKESSKVEKSQGLEKSAKAINSEEPSFLTSDTKLAFIKISSSRTHNRKLLALLKSLKIRVASMKFILACYFSLQRFRDTKNLSFRQVYWIQELSQYRFRFDY